MATSDILDSMFSIVPNPSKGEFSIKSKSEIKMIEVYSADGVKVPYENTSRQGYRINALSGVYSVKIIDDEGKTYNKKLLINR